MIRATALLSLASACLAASGPALAADPGAFAHSTPAVSGYDVVSYQTGAKPLRGNGNHLAVHDGETYLFVDDDNRKVFLEDPDRYVPAYGGYCAYGVAVGKKFVADPDVWRVVDGRLYLNLDNKIAQIWAEDVKGNIRKADREWKEIENADPASL